RAEGRRAAIAEGRAPRIHRHSEQATQRGRDGGPTGRRDSPRCPVGAYPGRRARATESASGGRSRRGSEADGDQTAAREGPQDHAGQRDAILAPPEETLSAVVPC